MDRPINQYVPWLQLDWPRAEEKITLRMLLSHSSGLPTEFSAQGPQDPAALATLLREELPHYRFVAPPGRYWSYSNVGMRLAAHIAEAVSGELLPRFMDRLVFEPLEMRRATFDPLMAMTYPTALPHDRAEDGQLRVVRPLTNNAARLPAGGMFASVLDLANFAILHLMEGRLGGKELLSASTIREMHRPQVFKFTLNKDFYGLALESDLSNGIKRIGHPGSFPPYGSRFTMVTEAGAAVILLVNRTTDFGKSATTIVNSVLSQLLECEIDDAPPTARVPEREHWAGFVGTYRDHLTHRATVFIDNDRLCASFGGDVIPLNCSRADLYFGTVADASKTIVVGFPEGGEYVIINNRPYRKDSTGLAVELKRGV